MLNKISDIILQNNLISKGCTVFVGVSGGSDSMCLIDILNKIKLYNLLNFDFNITCVHINHSLRGEDSDNDMKFVQNYCAINNLNFISFTEDINTLKKHYKMTIEEVARKVRKEKFESLLISKYDKIALAHNYSDNAETMLLHLFRGSGLNGLLAMDFIDNNIVRPLLSTSKDDIYSYLAENNIPYRTDHTNFEEIYSRNKIRLSLIPYIEKNFNNNIIQSINNTISSLKIDSDFIEQTSISEYKKISKLKIYKNKKMILLNIESLKNLHSSILVRIFFKAFDEINGSIIDFNSKNIEDLKKLLYRETGKKIILNKNITAFKGYNDIYFYNNDIITTNEFYTPINLNEFTKADINGHFVYIGQENKSFKNYECIKTIHFHCDKTPNFYIRNRRVNDRIYIKNIDGHKSIKKYFIEKKIDEIFRNDINLLFADDNLIMILDKNLISNDNFNIGLLNYYIKIFTWR